MESGIIKSEPARTIELDTPTSSSENKATEISERDALIKYGTSINARRHPKFSRCSNFVKPNSCFDGNYKE